MSMKRNLKRTFRKVQKFVGLTAGDIKVIFTSREKKMVLKLSNGKSYAFYRFLCEHLGNEK